MLNKFSFEINYIQKHLINFIISFCELVSLFLLFKLFIGNANLDKAVFIFTVLLYVLSGNLYKALISPMVALAIFSQLLNLSILKSFLEGYSFNYVFKIFVLLTAFVSIILRFSFQSNTKSDSDLNKIDLLSVITPVLLTSIAAIIHGKSAQLELAKSLRFLVSTGEDNAAWLIGLSQGLNLETNEYVFTWPSGNDVRSTTHLFLYFSREFKNYGMPEISVAQNAQVLEQLSFSLILFTALFLSLISFNYLKFKNVNSIFRLSVPLLIGTVTYFNLTSFVMFGHLPPVISFLMLVASLSFSSLLNKTVSKSRTSKLINLIFLIILLLSTGDAWWPIKPAILLAIAIMIFSGLASLFRKNLKRFSSNNIQGLVALFGLIFIFLNFSDVLNFVNNYVANIGVLVHIPGGTLSPGTLQILFAIFGFIGIYVATEKYRNKNIDQFKQIVFSLFIFYLLIVFISLITYPYAIEYAANKLGLFLVTLLIPIEILLASLLVSKYLKTFFGAITFFVSGLLLFLNLGSPTYSGNPSWNQITFPFVLKSNLQKQDTFVWEQALIDKINSSKNQKILCFNRNFTPQEFRSDVLTPEYRCSKYSAALQGFLTEDFTQYWLQVNLNASGPEEFLSRAPQNFYQDYEIFYIDELLDVPQNSTLNSITELLDSIKMLEQ